jgi:hypothetical protein
VKQLGNFGSKKVTYETLTPGSILGFWQKLLGSIDNWIKGCFGQYKPVHKIFEASSETTMDVIPVPAASSRTDFPQNSSG